MSDVGRLVAATLVAVAGCWLVVTGVAQRRPALGRMVAYLERPAPGVRDGASSSGWERGGRLIYRGRRPFDGAVLADLRLVQRPPEAHAAMLVAAAVAGLFAPALLVAIGQAFGVVSLGRAVPVGVALVGAAVAPLLVHVTMRSRAAEIRRDLRYQLSAYLDVVTMLLAANVGNEGALRQAARTGDGRLFVELRRRIIVAETSNRSLVSALAQLGEDLQLIELQQIAASAALGATAGAPVARSLAAKCATLRSALASEQETEARVRTGKITVPLVGMSVLIMAAVIYPALNV
jgi:Flp pilus assembly protein TadB